MPNDLNAALPKGSKGSHFKVFGPKDCMLYACRRLLGHFEPEAHRSCQSWKCASMEARLYPGIIMSRHRGFPGRYQAFVACRNLRFGMQEQNNSMQPKSLKQHAQTCKPIVPGVGGPLGRQGCQNCCLQDHAAPQLQQESFRLCRYGMHEVPGIRGALMSTRS